VLLITEKKVDGLKRLCNSEYQGFFYDELHALFSIVMIIIS